MQIRHALQEYASGYKVENVLSTTNLIPQWVVAISFLNFNWPYDQQLSIHYIYFHQDTSKVACLCGAFAKEPLWADDVDLCLDSSWHCSHVSSLFRTARPKILPSQTYDYDALTSFALKSSQLADWSTMGQAEPNTDETGERWDRRWWTWIRNS